MTAGRVARLRERLEAHGLDALLVSQPQNRRYLSGFTGSAGYLLITSRETIIAADSRYFEQASRQALGFRLYPIATPSLETWLPGLLAGLGGKRVGDEAADLPYATSNGNCGRGDDYDDSSTAHCLYYYDSGEDMIYELTVTEAMNVEITLDPNGTTYSGVGIGSTCPPTDDPECSAAYDSSGLPKTTDCLHLEPGTYYIQVDTWSSPDCIPDFDLTIVECIPPTGRSRRYWARETLPQERSVR